MVITPLLLIVPIRPMAASLKHLNNIAFNVDGVTRP